MVRISTAKFGLLCCTVLLLYATHLLLGCNSGSDKDKAKRDDTLEIFQHESIAKYYSIFVNLLDILLIMYCRIN